MAYDIGPKIGIDGEAEFRSQINQLNTVLRTLGTEMGAVTSQFGKNQSSQEAMTAKNRVLTKQIEEQKNKLEMLKKGLAESTQEYGENDSKTLKWQQTVNKATEELNKMKAELRDSEDALGDLGDGMDDAEESALSFGDILKASVLGQAIVGGIKKLAQAFKDFAVGAGEAAAQVRAETAQFSQTFDTFANDAEAAIGRVAESSGILPTRLNTVGTQIYAFARSSGASVEEAMSLTETSLQAAADSAAYYDKSLEDASGSLMSFLKGNYANDAALGVSATETTRNAAAMDLFGKKYNDLSEIQKQQTLLKMVTNAQELSGAMGQAAREADGWENVQGNLNETWRQFQAKMGDPLLSALIPIVQGITEAFSDWQNSFDWDKFNSSISKAVSVIMALAKIITGNLKAAFSAVSTYIERMRENFGKVIEVLQPLSEIWIASLTSSFQTLGTIISEYVIPFVSTMLAAWQNLGTSIAENITPALARIGEMWGEVFGKMVTLFNEHIVPMVSSFIQAVTELWSANQDKIGAVGELFGAVFNKIADILGWFKDNVILGILLPAITGIVDFVAENMDTVKNIFQGIFDAIGGIIKFFTALFQGDWKGMWEAVKQIASGASAIVKNLFALLRDALLAIGEAIKTAIVNRFNELKENVIEKVQNLKQSAEEAFENMKRAIAEKIGLIKETVINGIGAAADYVKEMPAKFKEWGADMIQGMIDGIKSKINDIKESISGVADTIRSYIHFTEPDVGPLSDFHTYMPDMGEMIVSGIRSQIPKVAAAMEGLTETMRIPVEANGGAAAFSGLAKTMGNLQVVLSDGTVVGKLSPAINTELGGYRQKEGRYGG